jgi:ParB-like chromosome segregation protein Spo0J
MQNLHLARTTRSHIPLILELGRAATLAMETLWMTLEPALIPIQESAHNGFMAAVESITASIREVGQQSPIVLDNDGNLIDGRKRVLAAKMLGIKVYAIRFADQISAVVGNIEQRLVADQQTVLRDAEDFYAWKLLFEMSPLASKHGGDRTKKSGGHVKFVDHAARLTGRSGRSISDLVRIAALIPSEARELLHSDTKRSNHQGTLLSLTTVADRDKLDVVRVTGRLVADPNLSVGQAVSEEIRYQRLNQACTLPDSDEAYSLRTGDCVERMAEIETDSVDAIITDPPYMNDYLPKMSEMAEQAARVLRPGGLFIALYGQMFLPEFMARVGEHLTWHWQYVVVYPPECECPVRGRKINSHYKPVVVFSKGRYEGQMLPDLIQGGKKDKEWHRWGQSLKEFDWLVNRMTKPNDLLLEPFLGGGTTMIAALRNKRRCIGIDNDPRAVEMTRRRIELQVKGEQ